MDLARLKQLKLEQQYIKKKKQAQIEAELIENELEIAIVQSKLSIFENRPKGRYSSWHPIR